MMLDVAYAMHPGTGHRQQDAMLVAGSVLKENSLATRIIHMSGDDALFAVADGVAASPYPSLTSAYALEILDRIHKER